MTVHGFCLREQINVPLTADRRCQNDNSPAIPPSWGSRNQTWIDGAWSPVIERPDGYVYKPKQFVAPGAPARPPISRDCEHCAVTFSFVPHGGTDPRYCGARCKGRAALERRREAAAR